MISARYLGQIIALLAVLALVSLVALAYSDRNADSVLSEQFAKAAKEYAAGNYEVSGKALLPLARSGDANAQALLAAQYLEGLGLSQDDANAAIWFYRAARRGHSPAQLAYGRLLLEGRGVAQNDLEAYRWLLLAASRDDGQTAQRAKTLASGIAPELDPEDRTRVEAGIPSWRPSTDMN